MKPISKKQISQKLLFFSTFIFAVFSPIFIYAQESEKEFHERMKWWEEGRLGMFLHWGVYSTFGGEYNGSDYGKEVGQASAEWIYLRSNMPASEYWTYP